MGDFRFHIARGELRRGDETIKLTERERDLLRQFAQKAGLPIARHELTPDENYRQRASDRRADQPPQTQDRDRSIEPGLFADRARQGLHPLHRLTAQPGPLYGRRPRTAMQRFQTRQPPKWATLKDAGFPPADLRVAALLAELVPKGLYARALIIIIAPIVLLEGVVAFVFMERHWNAVTRRLSEATVRDIAALIDVLSGLLAQRRVRPPDRDGARPAQPVDAGAAPDRPAARAAAPVLRTPRSGRCQPNLRNQIKQPFWIDTVGNSRLVEIKVKLKTATLRFVATRSQTYASNSDIFMAYMVGSSVILLTLAILFLRNQIRPILKLAEAADAFGKGRSDRRGVPPARRARGAGRRHRRSSKCASASRSTSSSEPSMLAGVSHDLRTILTSASSLQLEFLGDRPEIKGPEGRRQRDAAYAGGLSRLHARRRRRGGQADQPAGSAGRGGGRNAGLRQAGRPEAPAPPFADLVLPLKRQAFKRAITNLVSNAARFGDQIVIRAATERNWLRIEVDDGRSRYPCLRARQRVQAILPARPCAQPGRGQHRPWPGHRP